MITLDQLSKFVRNGKNAQAEIDRLCRTNNPQTSKDAAEKMVKSGALSRQEKKVYDEIVKYVQIRKQFTTKDIALNMSKYSYWSYDKCYDICRKRFSGLRDRGKIEITGDKRDGCRVWRLL
jgi:hypothetical protein